MERHLNEPRAANGVLNLTQLQSGRTLESAGTRRSVRADRQGNARRWFACRRILGTIDRRVTKVSHIFHAIAGHIEAGVIEYVKELGVVLE